MEQSKKGTDIEELINEVHELDADAAIFFQERLQKTTKFDIEYCEQCDSYRIDSNWHEDNRGNYICQSCYEKIGDDMYDRMQDELWGK